MNSYFVTGTDTGVGKTIVSTVLAVGEQAHYWKPVQTGSEGGTDTEFVSQWIGQTRTWPESYIFSEPLSPHLAAGDIEIDLNQCIHDFQQIKNPCIVEGAGGVLVPLNSKYLMIDLIKTLDLPVVVVTSTRLGTINHTLLTLEALRRRELKVIGVVTVGVPRPEVQQSLIAFGPARILGHVPHCDAFSVEWFQKTYSHLGLAREFNH